jgi:hypothetical protein
LMPAESKNPIFHTSHRRNWPELDVSLSSA